MKHKRLLAFLCGLVLGAIAIFCAWQIISTQLENAAQQKAFEDLLKPDSGSDSSSDEQTAQNTGDAFDHLFESYEDMVAWISIPDTVLNYPVMQTPDWPNYYLRRDMEGVYSTYGVPYMNEYCDLDDSDNLIIYGHSMKNGDMFGSLLKYQKQEYWEKHPGVHLRTPQEEREYTVLGAFAIDLASDTFDYNSFVNAYSDSAYNEYLRQVRARAYYDTGITAAPGDQLLTLSTCEYSLTDGRFVVVAVRTK